MTNYKVGMYRDVDGKELARPGDGVARWVLPHQLPTLSGDASLSGACLVGTVNSIEWVEPRRDLTPDEAQALDEYFHSKE